jgi:hypothetical protein
MQSISYTAKSITLDPVSRIEGHLKVDVVVDMVDGRQVVVDAKTTGTLFRGIETGLWSMSGFSRYCRFIGAGKCHWNVDPHECANHAQPRSGR